MTASALDTQTTIALTINGETVQLQGVSPTTTLLHYLQQTGRTGTKEGCGDGDCGACTVALIQRGNDGQPRYRAVNSCLVPVAAMADRDIITVEGIAQGALHPVQAAMVQTGGSQCGYCTPGFIMSMFAAYYDNQVADLTVEGNLCRCTGYLPIRRAAQMITEANADDVFSRKLQQANLQERSIHYSTGDQMFYRPLDLATVLDLLQQYPQATLVAGGTDLGLEMSHDRRSFPILISLETVAELQGIYLSETVVEIGAAVPLSQVQATLRGVFPSLDEMLHWFAACQVRNRATIGGNIGTASPIGDLPPVLLALDASVRLAGPSGERWLPLAEFFQGYRQTALQKGEVIRSVQIPRQLTPRSNQRFSQSYKIGKRGTDDISIVAAAFTVDVDEQGNVCHARLAYGGVAATPVRAIAVESMLLGKPWTMATVQQVKPSLRKAFNPLTDLRGSAAYRRTLVANLFEKFFVEMTGLV